jgi:hypothetical protein
MMPPSTVSVVDQPLETSGTSSNHGRQIVPYPSQVERSTIASGSGASEEEARRRDVVATLANDTHPYSDEENAMIAKGQLTMSQFLENTSKVKVSSSALVLHSFRAFATSTNREKKSAVR